MPKKKDTGEKKAFWGRPSNTLKIGIVGLPNVGKSSLFNLLTKLNVAAANYPFCTIEPNKAIVEVDDPRFDNLIAKWTPERQFKATLEIHDIAGLIRGASEGEGLGNEFLSHINGTDGIFEVVRLFNDPEIVHTEGEVDPIRDMEVIHDELIKKDLARAAFLIEECEKQLKRKKVPAVAEERDALVKAVEVMKGGLFVRHYSEWQNKEIDCLKEHGGGQIIPFSVAFETNLSTMQPEEQQKYLKDQGTQSAVSRIIKIGYKAIDLIHFFTVGHDEVKCWTIRQGTQAKKAAGCIHSDIEKGFICAEIYTYQDFLECGTEAEVKNQGKLKQCGKDYEVKDGDIVFFKHN